MGSTKGKFFNRLRKKNENDAKRHKADGVLLALIFVLLIFGLVMITSIGVPKSIQLSAPNILYPNCDDVNVDCYRVLKNHIVRLGIGVVMMFIAAKIPFRFWKKMAPFLFYGAVFVLFAVLILGAKYTTFARSWLVILNTSLQPTEFAKLALIFYLASWMEKRKVEIKSFQKGFLPFCVITGMLILPVLLQPDLGGTLVIAIIAVAMYFVGGASFRHLMLGGFVLILSSAILVASIGHVRQRFTTFLQVDKGVCRADDCWQSWQSEIAIGSGGFWGRGLTQGVQKSYWLPQATDDFIFAASAEELGFVRIGLLVIAYAAIAYRGFKIGRGASNRFAELAAIGISVWISFQAFVNIAVNLALMPVTGITLPFISYGGSSLISVLIAAGILLQISKYSDYAVSLFRRRERRPYHTEYSAH